MALDINTLLGGNLALLGGGPGALQNGGVGIGALTGGMAADREAAGMQGAASMQAGQDIQNATQLHALEQARLVDPQTAQAREFAMQGVGMDMATQGKYGMPSRDAAAQAKLEASFDALSTTKQHEMITEGASWKAANAAAEDAGKAAMANPDHPVHQVINHILAKGGVTGLPDDFSHQGAFLAAHAAAATATVDYAQKIGAIRATGEEAANQKYIEGEYAVKAQIEGAAGRFYQQLFSMEPARRTITLLQGEIAKQTESDGSNYYTSGQKAQYEGQALQAMQATGQLDRAAKFGEDRSQIVREGDDATVKAEAKRFGVPIDNNRPLKDQIPSIAADVKKAATEKQIHSYLDSQFANQFPGARLDDSKPSSNLLAPNGSPVTAPSEVSRPAGMAVATPMGQPAAIPPPTLSGRSASGQIGSGGSVASAGGGDGSSKATPIPYREGMKPADFKGKGLYITDPNGVVRGPT